MMFARNKGKKSFIDLIKGVNLFPVHAVKYYTLKLSFNTYADYEVNKKKFRYMLSVWFISKL